MKTAILASVALFAAGSAMAQNTMAPHGQPTGSHSQAGSPADTPAEASARQKLTAAGYSNVRSMRRSETGGWDATVMQDGKEHTVRLAADGTVSKTNPM